jgi:hypothetical protein
MGVDCSGHRTSVLLPLLNRALDEAKPLATAQYAAGQLDAMGWSRLSASVAGTLS